MGGCVLNEGQLRACVCVCEESVSAHPIVTHSPPATTDSASLKPAAQYVDIPLSPASSVPDLNLQVPKDNDVASNHSAESNKLFRAPNRRFSSQWHAVRWADQELVKKVMAVLAAAVLGRVLVSLAYYLSTGASSDDGGHETNKTGKMSHVELVAVH